MPAKRKTRGSEKKAADSLKKPRQTGGDLSESVSMQGRDEERVGGRNRRTMSGEDTAEGGRAPEKKRSAPPRKQKK